MANVIKFRFYAWSWKLLLSVPLCIFFIFFQQKKCLSNKFIEHGENSCYPFSFVFSYSFCDKQCSKIQKKNNSIEWQKKFVINIMVSKKGLLSNFSHNFYTIYNFFNSKKLYRNCIFIIVSNCMLSMFCQPGA